MRWEVGLGEWGEAMVGWRMVKGSKNRDGKEKGDWTGKGEA